MNPKKIKKIAVVNLGYVGDIVNSAPVVKQLKKHYPQSKLVYVTVPKSREIAKYIPGVDEVEIFDKDIEHKGAKIIPWALKFRLKHRIDMAVLLNETFRSAILATLFGSRYKVGHNSEGRGFLLTHTVPWLEEERDFKVHISKIYMRNLEAIGISTDEPEFGLKFEKEDEDFAQKIVEDNNLEGFTLVGLCPCARLDCKNWNVQEAGEFYDFISSKPNHKLVIIGQDSAVEFAKGLRAAGRNDFLDLSNKTTVPQLAAFLKKMEIFVTVDTAPMHMSLALKVPTIGIFVQDNYGKWWADYNNNSKLVYNNPVHAPAVIDAYKSIEEKIKTPAL